MKITIDRGAQGAGDDDMTDKQALDPRRVTWVIDQLREKADDAPGATRRGVMREAADMLVALRQQVERLTQERDELCDWKESALESFEQWHELGDVLLAFVPLTIGDNIPVKLASAIPAEVISLRQQLAALTAAQERMTWQPMETAEKDARAIVTDGHYVEFGYLWPRRVPVWTYDADGTKLRPQPTHWMPLPDPPAALPPHAASSPTTKDGGQ